MKKTVMLITLAIFTLALRAQINHAAQTHLLKHYYELAAALVNSDPVTAANRITDVINANDASGIVKEQTQKQLVNAGKVLDKQREVFSNLSAEIYAWIKSEKSFPDTVYRAYCPMKKMYWLTQVPVIKNPYYGKMMLTCGNITETIKQ